MLVFKKIKKGINLNKINYFYLFYFLFFTLSFTPYFVMSGYWLSLQAVQQRFPGCCQKSEFDCGDGTCIPLIRFHDGNNDCTDGSDEFCFPGQIKCGDSQFCADSIHLTECLLFIVNSSCKTSNNLEHVELKVPSFCKFLSAKDRRHCHLHNSIYCKGYSQCILSKWIMDGKRDCLDGSDEDLDYVGLFNMSFGPFLPLLFPSYKFKNLQTTTETFLNYSKLNSEKQLIWPPHGKIIKPINKNIKQKIDQNKTWTTTPIYPFVKAVSSEIKQIKSEEETKSEELENNKNIEIEETTKLTTQKTTTESTTTLRETTLTEYTTNVLMITSEVDRTITSEITNQNIENVEFYSSTLQQTIVYVTTNKPEQVEEINKNNSLFWLFLLLLILFCFCCLLLPFIWLCCFSKQRQNTNVFMLRRCWKNLKLKLGIKQTQPTLLPTTIATTITTSPINVIPQSSGISIISESIEESKGIVAERENTLKIPSIGEVGRIASLAQAWQQQHQQSKIFDDSEDYLIMEEGEEETEVTDADLRRQSSIATFLDKGKTIEKKDTTTTKTTTTTTITDEEKLKQEVEEKEGETLQKIEIQKSSTSDTNETFVNTKIVEIIKENSEKLIQLPKLSIERVEEKKEIEETKETELQLPPRSSSITSRPGTPTIWDQFKVLGEQYSGGDDQIALATERRDSLDDILLKMDTLEKQKTERSEVIEELNEQEEEGKELVEDEIDKIKIEEMEDAEKVIKERDEEEEGEEKVEEKIKLEEEIKELKEIEDKKIIKINDLEKKDEKLIPKIQTNIPSIPPKKLTLPSTSLFKPKIKTTKEFSRVTKPEKITQLVSKQDDKDVYVVVKGYRVDNKQKQERTEQHVLKELKQQKQQQEKRQMEKQQSKEKQTQKPEQITPPIEEKRKTKEKNQNIKLGIRQRRERLLRLKEQKPIHEYSFEEETSSEPTFDPDLPSTSNYQYFATKTYKKQNLNRLTLPQIGEQIEQKVHSGCIISGRQPWNSNININKLPPLIIEQRPTSSGASPERIETLIHSGCITNREPWNSSPQLNPSSPSSSKRLKTTENIFKPQTSGRRQPRPRPRSRRELTDPDWEKEDYKNNYFGEFYSSYSKRQKATSSPDTKEESETNSNNYYSKIY